MNLQNFNFEVLDLGIVYYKNVIKEPSKVIDAIENLDRKANGNYTSCVRPWEPWINDSAGTNEVFCWKKYLPKVSDIPSDDPYKDDQLFISSTLNNALESTLAHYSNAIYPFAAKNVKSSERMMQILKYEKAGFLPPHQDQGVSTRVLSVLLYLNDDYEGGELEFPHSKLKFKPEPGSVLFFPSNFLYVHMIHPVTKGPRYALPNWYHNVKEDFARNSTGEE